MGTLGTAALLLQAAAYVYTHTHTHTLHARTGRGFKELFSPDFPQPWSHSETPFEMRKRNRTPFRQRPEEGDASGP